MWYLLFIPVAVFANHFGTHKFRPMESVFTPGIYQRENVQDVQLVITHKKPHTVYDYGYVDDCGLPDICGKDPK